MIIKAIVAADSNWAIGKNGGLIYSLPKDLKYFKNTTKGHFIIMGINTLNSLPNGKPLKDRITICIDPSGEAKQDCIVVKSTQECLDLMKEISAFEETEFYVCGGAYCYKEFLPYYDVIYVNKIKATDPEATVFFPNIDADDRFVLASKASEIADNGYVTQLHTYVRKDTKNV